MTAPTAVESDDRPPQKPPGVWAWGLTVACLISPVLGAAIAAWGITNNGDDVAAGPFFSGFGLLVLSAILSVVVHLWGMVRAFYPRVSGPWITVCLLGIVGGLITLGAGVYVMMRLYGAA
jgi:hypothetical protein